MSFPRLSARWPRLVGLAGLVLLLGAGVFAQTKQPPAWDTTQARGQTRDIDFDTSEGTWMSVDLSPDGRWIVFDLLAQIYRVPAAGGTAQCLTQASGVALNFHPRYSPDGKTIAFVSDRRGQNNLWLMNADGSDPRSVFIDPGVRVSEPAWTPDGEYIIVHRQIADPPPDTPPSSGIWMYHREGGKGIELVGRDVRAADWPAVSPDGRYVYFHYAAGQATSYIGHQDETQGYFQIQRLDLRTGKLEPATAGVAQQQVRSSNGGAIAPELSPDGRWMAFARRIPDGTISYKGHKFGPRTALWLRDMNTGAERVLMDPIEEDMAETIKVWRVLPGYSWAADSKSVVIAAGGKIRRVWIDTGKVDTIPFTAHVHRTISEQARAERRITDDPFPMRFARWQTASPDGSKLAFQAVGRVWIMDLPGGTPRRLTPDSFAPATEYAPAWSHDGQWIAFTSWDEKEGGEIWKEAASGGAPVQLTRLGSEYLNPVWSPDDGAIVVARGSGADFRGQTWAENIWYDLVKVPAGGGQQTEIVRVDMPPAGLNRRQIVEPSFGPEGRLYYPAPARERVEPGPGERTVTQFVSVKPDGSDLRVHLVFPFADEAAASPDGKWVAFQEGDNVYVAAFPAAGAGSKPPTIEKRNAVLPVKQVSFEGGNFPRWRDAHTLEYGSANRYYVYHVDTGKTDATEIHLLVPRAIPKGSVALVGARIITMDARQEVIERGTIVVRGARIACVGQCSTAGVGRVINVKGKTIIPGLIDMHAHHHKEYSGITPPHDFEAAINLAYGVTTTLDPSMWSDSVFPQAEMIDAGLAIGPRTYSTGDPLYRGDGARNNNLTSYKVAEDNITRLASYGAITLKQYLQPRREQHQWIVDIARKQGLNVTAEGDSLEYDLGMTMDGQTGFEHPLSYAPLYSDATKFFGMAHMFYSPTAIVGGSGPWNEEYFFQSSDLYKDPKLLRWTPWLQLVPHTRRRMLRPATDYSYPMIAQALADVIASGGYGALGGHGQQNGIGTQWELWMYASAMTPMQALEVGTIDGARYLGFDRDLGSLEAGKLADLVVLNANPLADIHNSNDIEYVMKGGVLYNGDTLDEVWPEAKPFGENYWVFPPALQNDDRPADYWDHH